MYKMADDNLLGKLGKSARDVVKEIDREIPNNVEYSTKIIYNKVAVDTLSNHIDKKRQALGLF